MISQPFETACDGHSDGQLLGNQYSYQLLALMTTASANIVALTITKAIRITPV